VRAAVVQQGAIDRTDPHCDNSVTSSRIYEPRLWHLVAQHMFNTPTARNGALRAVRNHIQ